MLVHQQVGWGPIHHFPITLGASPWKCPTLGGKFSILRSRRSRLAMVIFSLMLIVLIPKLTNKISIEQKLMFDPFFLITKGHLG
jgi:hypothetical protein